MMHGQKNIKLVYMCSALICVNPINDVFLQVWTQYTPTLIANIMKIVAVKKDYHKNNLHVRFI
jgi:hypothetical protein